MKDRGARAASGWPVGEEKWRGWLGGTAWRGNGGGGGAGGAGHDAASTRLEWAAVALRG
jgi:hypothetical protein